jgi:anti-sigma regulatory factor (Ser/Thr protein kinase)
MDRQLVFDLPNDVSGVEAAVESILLRCDTCRAMAPTHQFNLRVSLAEALANAMLYGNAGDPRKHVRVEVQFERSCLRICVVDQGPGFDRSRIPNPLSEEGLERDCGRGIFLMRKLMDEVHFNELGNAVTLVLRFARDADPVSIHERGVRREASA